MILRGKQFGFSLEAIAEMIGQADTSVNALEQIERRLEFGEVKLRHIAERKKEMSLLEQDLIATRDKLLKRKKELKKEEAQDV